MKGIKGYLASLFDKEFIPTGLKTALFVGSLLFVINHGSATLRGDMTRDRWISGALTYLMPYLVNVYGQHTSRCRGQQSRPLIEVSTQEI
ncbi:MULTISPECIES: nitrate/nitrite transporter NrtS [Trichocoleus]|uniref:nitrate/nitrite transporter NrtS n=1 Tax=Trichocoleus TaxID=450526 RepID=UPI0016839358|nr:nitrate/nitrite transporter NrtS [Trichocoleus sp. FACHB-262]MBD2120134.1 nitrate/nitrite transporter NrtS [Trichocoleus sp. FACHB-262]